MREEGATILAAMLWGSSFVVIKYGLRFADPFLFLFLRFLVALLLVAMAYPILRRKPDTSLLKDRTLLLLALANTGGYVFEYVGMTFITATKSALLVNLGVIFVAVFSYYFLHERFTKTKASAVVVGLAGVFLLATKGNLSSMELGDFFGNAISLASALMWALVMILNKRAVGRVNLLDLTFIMEIYTLLFISPFLLFSHSVMTGKVLAISSFTGIFYSILPFLLWSYGLRKISATSSSIILLLEIFFATLFAFLFLSERLGSFEICGGILILAAIYLATRQ